MQTIKATIGERILNDNGEVIKYIGGQTDNGECYKDLDAWKSGKGVIYISEYGLIDLDNGSLNCDDVMWTREAWLEWVRIEVYAVYGECVEDEFIEWVAEGVLQSCDWQDLSTLLNEYDFDGDDYQYWRENIKKK